MRILFTVLGSQIWGHARMQTNKVQSIITYPGLFMCNYQIRLHSKVKTLRQKLNWWNTEMKGVRWDYSWANWIYNVMSVHGIFYFYTYLKIIYSPTFGCLGSSCCMWGFCSCQEWGLPVAAVRRLPIGKLLVLWSIGSRYAGSASCGTWAQQLELTGSSAGAQ